jgi:hypothetical protein
VAEVYACFKQFFKCNASHIIDNLFTFLKTLSCNRPVASESGDC